jgi:molybdate transport system ATP-binding protein
MGDAVIRAQSLSLNVGSRLHLALSPRDVMLAADVPEGLSARNRLRGRIAWLLQEARSMKVAVELDGAPPGSPALQTVVTPMAARELRLRPGGAVVALFKSSALRGIEKEVRR